MKLAKCSTNGKCCAIKRDLPVNFKYYVGNTNRKPNLVIPIFKCAAPTNVLRIYRKSKVLTFVIILC